VLNIFQGLGENTCSLQPALKSNAPGLETQDNFNHSAIATLCWFKYVSICLPKLSRSLF